MGCMECGASGCGLDDIAKLKERVEKLEERVARRPTNQADMERQLEEQAKRFGSTITKLIEERDQSRKQLKEAQESRERSESDLDAAYQERDTALEERNDAIKELNDFRIDLASTKEGHARCWNDLVKQTARADQAEVERDTQLHLSRSLSQARDLVVANLDAAREDLKKERLRSNQAEIMCDHWKQARDTAMEAGQVLQKQLEEARTALQEATKPEIVCQHGKALDDSGCWDCGDMERERDALAIDKEHLTKSLEAESRKRLATIEECDALKVKLEATNNDYWKQKTRADQAYADAEEARKRAKEAELFMQGHVGHCNAMIAGLRSDLEAERTENYKLEEKIKALGREADRLRHGDTIEGDFVCPDTLRMTDLESVLKALKPDLQWVLDKLDLPGAGTSSHDDVYKLNKRVTAVLAVIDDKLKPNTQYYRCRRCEGYRAEKKPDVMGWDGYCPKCGLIAQSEVGPPVDK